MKILSVRYRSGNGDLAVLDDVVVPGKRPMQTVFFCLSGKRNYLCGSTRVPKDKGKVPPELGQVRSLIERLDFSDTTSPKHPYDELEVNEDAES